MPIVFFDQKQLFGISDGRQCYCADYLTDKYVVDDYLSCDQTCAGDVETICGGRGVMTLWSRGGKLIEVQLFL